jgi:hypothetical protein
MEACSHLGRKRHARLRHQPGGQPLWVGDPDDWAAVRQRPRPPLVCPEPGCDVELISYENFNNQYNPRIFKFKSANRSCDHWTPLGLGGGPPSPEHEWLKLQLSRIATELGYTTTPEHPPTRSDVFVHEASFCLEVQLRSTQFRKRTASRTAKDAKVCWFIRDGLDSEVARKALFGLPAVRFRVVQADNSKPRRPVAPWEDSDDRELAAQAVVEVFGTVASPALPQERPSAAKRGWFRTQPMDAVQFLTEVLSGERRWYRPNMLGHRTGLWALRSDVSSYYASRKRTSR